MRRPRPSYDDRLSASEEGQKANQASYQVKGPKCYMHVSRTMGGKILTTHWSEMYIDAMNKTYNTVVTDATSEILRKE